MGLVGRVEPVRGVVKIAVDLGPLAEGLRVGDSVAASGCCHTVVKIAGTAAEFEAIPETMDRTWFHALKAGSWVNLERAMRMGARLDGHIVQGHVDGVARVASREERGGEVRIGFEADERLTQD